MLRRHVGVKTRRRILQILLESKNVSALSWRFPMPAQVRRHHAEPFLIQPPRRLLVTPGMLPAPVHEDDDPLRRWSRPLPNRERARHQVVLYQRKRAEVRNASAR